MIGQRNLYIIASIAAVGGCAWVLLHLLIPGQMALMPACIFRYVTGYPCPSCGSTHAVLKIFQLNWVGAFYDNPIGFILAATMIMLPLWLLYDLVGRKSTFYTFYASAESFIRRRWVAITLIALVVANWAWNIHKYAA